MHLSLFQPLLLIFLCNGTVGLSADRSLGQLLAVDTRIGRLAANAGDIDLHEAIEHVAALAGVVEWNHMTGVVEEHVGEVTGGLVDASGLAFEGPVMARGPDAGGGFEAAATLPIHVVDQSLCSDMVADEVFVAAEEQDVDTRLDQSREQVDGGKGVLCGEGHVDHTSAFCPAGFLCWVDVQGFDDIRSLEIRLNVFQVRGPVHATRFGLILETDIVHIVTLLIFGGSIEELLQD